MTQPWTAIALHLLEHKWEHSLDMRPEAVTHYIYRHPKKPYFITFNHDSIYLDDHSKADCDDNQVITHHIDYADPQLLEIIDKYLKS